MSSDNSLVKKVENQLVWEEESKSFYESCVGGISDPFVKKTIERIIGDEQKHIDLCKSMLADLAGEVVESHPDDPFSCGPLSIFDDVDVELGVFSIEDYMGKIVELLKHCPYEGKVLYLSYNKTPKYTKKLFDTHGIDLKGVSFISCSTSQSEEHIKCSPTNLTELTSILRNLFSDSPGGLLVVDTVNAFLTYHEEKIVLKFIGSINDFARDKGYKVLWVSIGSEGNREFNTSVSQLCDVTQGV